MQTCKSGRFETASFIGAVVLALGAAGCGAGGETAEASTGSVQQALSPGWTWTTTGTNAVSLISYYDGRAISSVDTSGHVTQWSDQTSSNNDLQNSGSHGPTVLADAFGSGMDGLDFSGGELLRDTSWTGVPTGNNVAYTVLAIAQLPSPASPQTASLAAWWNPNGYDAVRCQVAPNSGNTDSVMQESRADGNGFDQWFTGSTDLGTTAHALGWLYTPEVLRTFVDGATQASSTLTSLSPIADGTFLVGARSDLPTQLFTGTIGQVYVFRGNLSSSDLGNFYSYAQAYWGAP